MSVRTIFETCRPRSDVLRGTVALRLARLSASIWTPVSSAGIAGDRIYEPEQLILWREDA